jgi:hypothetical protein
VSVEPEALEEMGTARWVYLGRRRSPTGGKTYGRWRDLRFPQDHDNAVHHYEKPSASWIIGGEYEVTTNEDGSRWRGQPRLDVFRTESLSELEINLARMDDETFKIERDAEAYSRKVKGDIGSLTLRDIKATMAEQPMRRAAILAAALRYLRA